MRRKKTTVFDNASIKEMTVEVIFGEITDTIKENIALASQYGHHEEWARLKGALITFVFNGVTVSVRMDSDPELIYRDWLRAMHGYIDKNVGPYPNSVLTDDELAFDAKIEAKNERKRKSRQAEYEAKAKVHREATEAKLAEAPEIEIGDAEVWQTWKDNNQDGYGGAVIDYAERWARLMQARMNKGEKLADIAKETSHEADIDGITGFMYGAAVSTLASSWKHGEALRLWHNLDTQLGDEGEKANEEGGVLNPALLNIGTS